MPELLTAEYRLRMDIVVNGLTHKMRQFCEASPSLLASSGYFLFDRSGLATIDAQDAATYWWNPLATIYGSIVAAPQWILEARDGVVWNPVTAGVTSGAGSSGSSYYDAFQRTISFRSSVFTRLRLVILEQNKSNSPNKLTSIAAFSALFGSTLADAITGVDANPAGYFQWARSKNKRELHETSPYISCTGDLNDKVRRARGMQ
jgi:hypothetical protein